MNDEYQDVIDKFHKDILDLFEKYKDQVKQDKAVYRMIASVTSISLCWAPNEVIGIKTVLSIVETYKNMLIRYRAFVNEENKNDKSLS